MAKKVYSMLGKLLNVNHSGIWLHVQLSGNIVSRLPIFKALLLLVHIAVDM